jgi:hypothetical protein
MNIEHFLVMDEKCNKVLSESKIIEKKEILDKARRRYYAYPTHTNYMKLLEAKKQYI